MNQLSFPQLLQDYFVLTAELETLLPVFHQDAAIDLEPVNKPLMTGRHRVLCVMWMPAIIIMYQRES